MSNKDSSVNIGNGNTFGGDTAIGEGAKIEKHIHDNSVNYIGNKVDFTSIENVSKYITNNFNEKKIGIWAGIVSIVGLLGDFLSINTVISSILPSDFKLISFVPYFNSTVAWIIFSVSLLFLIGGVYVLSAISHKYDSTCPKCRKHYAIDEKENPPVREVKAHDGIKKTTFRHYFCRHCDFEKKDPKTVTIPYDNKN